MLVPVSIGATVCRVKFIVPVAILFALSFTTTCNIYVPSQLPVTVGFCTINELNVIVHPVGHDSFDRVYHDIQETFPSILIFIPVATFVILSAGIVTTGAVLSILYICTQVVTLPALSCTHAYTYHVPSVLSTGTVVDHPLQY